MKSDFTAEQLKAILESVHDAVYIGAKNGMSTCNQQFLDLLGCKEISTLSGGIEELNRKINSRLASTGKRISQENEPFVRALKGTKVVEELVITNLKTGKDMFVRCAASPISLNNELIGAVAVYTDITEKKLAEKRLKDAIKEVETVNKELQAFTYAVSHDLKSPLSSIYGLAALLLKSDESQISDKDKYMINLIMQSSEKLGKLINQMLQLAKISKIEFNYTSVNLSNIAHMVLDNYTFEHKTKPEVEIEENMTAYGDEALLHSVVQNLLTNAIKYSSKRPNPKIKMGVKEGKEKKIFYVEDNGVGFDPDRIDDLFKPFKRLHQNSEFAGSGIGLSTVKRIIERHGGHVWADGKLGKGATFYFSLPDSQQMAHLKDREPYILSEEQKDKVSA
ncbi:PAS domain-containing sensor histidine kinase [Nafulsella turpanensis]|uniref:PAS domain-containing sensor histidine kinase n=1 Tax=Nafulsella turpanensis TaxID=1265690 RepID=UPI00034D6E47|nr:PAS domain-containing sensor histidine kinase [Nafulsella turpanensis]